MFSVLGILCVALQTYPPFLPPCPALRPVGMCSIPGDLCLLDSFHVSSVGSPDWRLKEEPEVRIVILWFLTVKAAQGQLCAPKSLFPVSSPPGLWHLFFPALGHRYFSSVALLLVDSISCPHLCNEPY